MFGVEALHSGAMGLQFQGALYSKETITLFEHIRSRLANGDVAGFLPMGQTYKVAG
jgi:hypothetical protein